MKKYMGATVAASALTLILSGPALAQESEGYGTAPGAAAQQDQPATNGAAGGDAAMGGEQQDQEQAAIPEPQVDQETARSQRASGIIGQNVVNAQGEDLGSIDELVIDEEGQVTHAILSSGGLLGMGEKLVAVPWEDVQAAREADEVVVNLTEQQIEQAPGIDRDDWPADFSAFEVRADGETGAQPGAADGAGPEEQRGPATGGDTGAPGNEGGGGFN